MALKLLDLTLNSPEENLALDEALLLEAERCCHASWGGGQPMPCSGEVVRFWESPTYFVVLGAGGHLSDEVHVEACRLDGIPILRRDSGGGTVLQGPGCLNYALVLDVASHPECADISGTNRYVLSRLVDALAGHWPAVAWRGTSDLALGDRKISGTAQRRKRRHLLFHGTLLYDFRIDLLEKYLRIPHKQPQYRQRRPHAAFVANIPAPASLLKELISSAWDASVHVKDYPRAIVAQLVAEKYSRREWNERF